MGGKTFLESYLDFCFIFCISPFTLRRNAHPAALKIQRFCPQKILALLVAVMDIFGSVTRIRINYYNKLDNPVDYFKFLWAVAACLMHCSFYFVLWTKQQHIAEAIGIFVKRFSSTGDHTSEKKLIFQCSFHSLISFLLCVLSLFLAVLPSIKGSFILPNPSTTLCWSPSTIFKGHVERAQFMFSLDNPAPKTLAEIIMTKNYTHVGGDQEKFLNLNDINDTISTNDTGTSFNIENPSECKTMTWPPFNGSELLQGTGHVLIYTSRYVGSYFLDLFMMTTVLMMWMAVKSFTEKAMRPFKNNREERLYYLLEMKTDAIPATDQIHDSSAESTLELPRHLKSPLEKYEDLKSLNESINYIISPILFCYVFEAIFYYATNLNTIFTARDWHARLQVAHFLVGCSIVLGLSADVTRKMDAFRLWLVNGETRKSVESERLMILIHETQSKAVAISAFGIFTVDYPLIFNIVTTTVTFFLIVVQFVPTC